jgi:hypothetical protein
MLAATTFAACSSDGGSSDEPATVDETVGMPSVVATPDTEPAADDADSSQSSTLTAAEICERLSIDSVAAELGLDVMNTEPDDSATPQCAYFYTNDTGATSNLTVAAMRPDDVGGATGQEAFDFVVRVNEGISGDGAERQDIDAGDNATRLTGASLHLGVLQVGDQVYTVIVPVGDATADDIDRLLATMATTLAGR